jgi:hypothetical protein
MGSSKQLKLTRTIRQLFPYADNQMAIIFIDLFQGFLSLLVSISDYSRRFPERLRICDFLLAR